MIQKEQNANGFYIFSSGSFALFFCSDIVRISGKRPGRQQHPSMNQASTGCLVLSGLQEPGGRTSWPPLGDNVEDQGNEGLTQSHLSGQ